MAKETETQRSSHVFKTTRLQQWKEDPEQQGQEVMLANAFQQAPLRGQQEREGLTTTQWLLSSEPIGLSCSAGTSCIIGEAELNCTAVNSIS